MIQQIKPLFLLAIKISFASFSFFCLLISPKIPAQSVAVGSVTNESKEYLETIQKATFGYFWDFAHPVSGMASERTATPNIVTSGGTGFGVMCIVVGTERKWVSRNEAVQHLLKMTTFLKNADRFHGAWSHWMDGRTGRVVPFGQKDNGGDLVETAYLINGLLVARQYFDKTDAKEQLLRKQITDLWESVEWDWYASRGDGFLYWHWSPNYNWDMNMPIRGYNECLITYVLAMGSPTHGVKPAVYEQTWKNSDFYKNGKTFLGYQLPLGFDKGGPLFFAHYSYLSLDPRLMADDNTNYWQQNLAHTLINYEHGVTESRKEFGYSSQNWGLTASDDYNFYDAHSPTNDNGTISPTAALSSFPYLPFASYQAMRYLYLKKGNQLFGKYGFYDAYNASLNWYSNQYLAIDQGPIVVMMENYRSGLIWKMGEKISELQKGLSLMGIKPSVYDTGFYAYLPKQISEGIELMVHPDYATYLLDFAVKGFEPVEIRLINEKNETTLILPQKMLKEGIQQVGFNVQGGEYKAIIIQGKNQVEAKLMLK